MEGQRWYRYKQPGLQKRVVRKVSAQTNDRERKLSQRDKIATYAGSPFLLTHFLERGLESSGASLPLPASGEVLVVEVAAC